MRGYYQGVIETVKAVKELVCSSGLTGNCRTQCIHGIQRVSKVVVHEFMTLDPLGQECVGLADRAEN